MNEKSRNYSVLVFFIFIIICANIFLQTRSLTNDEKDMIRLANAGYENSAYWVRPTYKPHFFSIDKTFEKRVIAPPLFSLLITAPLYLGIHYSVAYWILPLIIYAGGLLFLTTALSKLPITTCLSSVILALGLSPYLQIRLSLLEAEIPLTGFCLIALALSLKTYEGKIPAGAPIFSGICLGAAFLLKLWLAAPVIITVFAVFAYRAIHTGRYHLFLLFFLSFILVSSAHLFFIWIIDPANLTKWMKYVYFSPFLNLGVAGEKLTGSIKHPEWNHGFIYYFGAILRDLGFVIPFAAFGLFHYLFKEKKEIMKYIALGMLFLTLIIISIPTIKEPLYILPFTSILVSLGACEILRINKISTIAVSASIALLSLALSLGFLAGQLTYSAKGTFIEMFIFHHDFSIRVDSDC